ncbi:MAG: FeoA family protein [Verrucomicrobiota bacterium]
MTPENLNHLAIGEKAKVVSFSLPPETRQRLMEMGLTVGTECSIVRFAPMGDPMELRVRGYHLSLRKAEAEGVFIQRL